jgi:predicted ArsR family transcriptional regulator
MQIVQGDPGVTRAYLAENLQCPEGTLRHHLRALVQGELLTKYRVQRQWHYVLNSASNGGKSWSNALRRQHTRQSMLRLLDGRQGGDAAWLASQLGISTTAVRKQASLLESAGLLRIRRVGGRVFYFLAG